MYFLLNDVLQIIIYFNCLVQITTQNFIAMNNNEEIHFPVEFFYFP